MYNQLVIEKYMKEYDMNFEQMMAHILKQEVYCESGKLKHLIHDRKMELFIKSLEVYNHILK